jgi:hypothetical protein
MSKITLKEQPQEVFFKTTTQYKFDVDGKEQIINIEEDSNSGQIHYHYDDTWSTEPPDWIVALGNDGFHGLIFESTVWENKSGWEAGETIDTELE